MCKWGVTKANEGYKKGKEESRRKAYKIAHGTELSDEEIAGELVKIKDKKESEG
jgi:hypothetical protein